jgi:tolkin protein
MHHAQQQQCDYDRLEIYSKLSEEKTKKHGVFCGSKAPGPIISEGNVMRITFSSDISVQKTGFAAIFFTGKL